LILIESVCAFEPCTDVVGHPRGNGPLQLGAGSEVEGSAANEDQRPRCGGMRGRIGEREHGAPGRPEQGGMAALCIHVDDLMQVRHVPRHRQALAAAAALERFDNAV